MATDSTATDRELDVITLAAAPIILDEMYTIDEAEDALLYHLVNSFNTQCIISSQRKDASRNRKFRQRREWSWFSHYMSHRQFRRYFRMTNDCFTSLCNRIATNHGEHQFRSEDYINNLYDGNYANSRDMVDFTNLAHAARSSTGDFISGEVKVAMTLRILAGGTYMDLGLIFEIGETYAYQIFHDVIGKWILDDRLVKINGIDYCNNDARMQQVALEFARASNGVINGCIGALDGWIVKIAKPTKRDGVMNPKSFYSRKGFFGVSVQAIVDKKKRILFRSIESRGAEHDSSAFKHTELYTWLLNNWVSLARKGFYFIGDSAYSLKSFLLTPYDNTRHGTAEDNYNFFHSSSRIVVECAFGEVDLRWGILWKPLRFSLRNNIRIIDVCMRLHNLIVDYRESAAVDDAPYERELFDDECRRFLAVNADMEEGGVHGGESDIQRDANFEPYRGGRPTSAESASEKLGRNWRDAHRDSISAQRLVRPLSNWYRSHNRMYQDN